MKLIAAFIEKIIIIHSSKIPQKRKNSYIATIKIYEETHSLYIQIKVRIL